LKYKRGKIKNIEKRFILHPVHLVVDLIHNTVGDNGDDFEHAEISSLSKDISLFRFPMVCEPPGEKALGIK
jgi:hypothetical protein